MGLFFKRQTNQQTTNMWAITKKTLAFSASRSSNKAAPLISLYSRMASSTIYDFSAQTIQGDEHSLDRYKGRVVLAVNTASL